MAESANPPDYLNPTVTLFFLFFFFVVFTILPTTVKMNQEHYEIYRQSRYDLLESRSR